MAKIFNAPLRFTEAPDQIVIFEQDNAVHVVGYYEHKTLHCGNAPATDINRLVEQLTSLLQDNREGRHLELFDTAVLGLTAFLYKHPTSVLMGDSKPGTSWEYVEDKSKYVDIWNDGVTWHKWISPEHIAQEFYSREVKRNETE